MSRPSAAVARPSQGAATGRIALTLVVAVAITIALNAVVAAIAGAAGATPGYGPLTFPAYGLFTALGFIAGWFGWTLIVRRAARPAALLRVLVPVVLVLSFIPDVVLLITGFIPGTTAVAAVALMVMHVIVVAIAVPTYARLAPPRG
jgi:hypothetical protein